MAFAVDYGLTPKRFRPGFENVLSKKALVAFYAAIAIGLIAGEHLRRKHGGGDFSRPGTPSTPGGGTGAGGAGTGGADGK